MAHFVAFKTLFVCFLTENIEVDGSFVETF